MKDSMEKRIQQVKNYAKGLRDCKHPVVVLYQTRNKKGHIQQYPTLQCQCCGNNKLEWRDWFKPALALYLKTDLDAKVQWI